VKKESVKPEEEEIKPDFKTERWNGRCHIM